VIALLLMKPCLQRLGGVLPLLFLFIAGCEDKYSEPPRPPRCCAEVRILNLARNSPRLDGWVSYYNTEQRMITDLGLREVFPKEGYWTIDATDPPKAGLKGDYPQYRIQLVTQDSSLKKGNILSDTHFVFNKGERYLAFLTDRAPKRPGWVVLKDRKYTFTDPKATFLRVLQLGNQSNLYLKVTKNTSTTAPNVGYGQISNYLPQLPDFYTLELYSGNNFLTSISNMRLEAGVRYTFYYDGQKLDYYSEGASVN